MQGNNSWKFTWHHFLFEMPDFDDLVLAMEEVTGCTRDCAIEVINGLDEIVKNNPSREKVNIVIERQPTATKFIINGWKGRFEITLEGEPPL
jgi:hypothetical protein